MSMITNKQEYIDSHLDERVNARQNFNFNIGPKYLNPYYTLRQSPNVQNVSKW